MESENVDVNHVAENTEMSTTKSEIASTHTLGLQDLFKAAFGQETVINLINFNNKAAIVSSANLTEEPERKYFDGEPEKIEIQLEKTNDVLYKGPNFGETYQLYSLKGLDYTTDFVKPEGHSLDLNNLNFEESKVKDEVLTGTILNCPYESFQNDSNQVLDLDKGIQVHRGKADETPVESSPSTDNRSSTLTYNHEKCEYTGDAQILQRYLCDSGSVSDSAATVETIALNFPNKQNNNVGEKSFYDSDSVGINPETLGIRFEDCDFNSSDSFASTESIIPKNVKCPKCPKKFMFKSDLLRHDKYKHSVKPKLFCKYCNKDFVSQQNLLFHEKSHKKKRNSYKCETCKKVFKKSSLLVKHILKTHSSHHSKTDSFSCPHCGKAFPSQILLDRHFRKSHFSAREKPFKCEICSKSFEKKQGLSCHAKAHLLEEQPHVCRVCSKSFSKMCYLKNHEKSHQEEKEGGFVCVACGKDCRTQTGLEEHSRKHTGEKPFTCNVCLKSFAYKAYFKVHIKKHAEVKQFTCSQCPKSFVTSSDLIRHEKSHAGENFYRCIECNREFVQQSNLIAHWKKKKCSRTKQEVCTQTNSEFADGVISSSGTNLQNVSIIVNDQAFAIHHHQQQQQQQPILLTSIGNFIASDSVPVVLTQCSTGPYSASSIT